MAMLFWYLVKSDVCVRYRTVVYSGQITLLKEPETHGHVKLVNLSLKVFGYY